jgi:MATE family multidrug resistance protein
MLTPDLIQPDKTPAQPLPGTGLATHPTTVELFALMRLAAPLILTQLAQMAIMTTDVVMLGRLSTHALAAAALGNTVFYFCWLLATGPAQAVSPIIANLIGAHGEKAVRLQAGVRRTVRMGLWSSVLTTLPLALILMLAKPILVALGQEPSLAEDAGKFSSMLAIGLPFSIGFQVLRNYATALGRTREGLWVMIASIAWNAGADYALIFGKLGAPKLGIIGGGLATSSSSVFAFLALLTLVLTSPELKRFRILRRARHGRSKPLVELIRLGGPIGVTMLLEAMLFNCMTLLVGTFGASPLAAHQIALNVASFTFMVPLGVAMATTVRVGQFAGAGDLPGARRAGYVAMGTGTALAGLSALLMLFAGRPIAELYVSGRAPADLAVIGLTTQFLVVAAAFQLADALQVVGNLALRGLKDARAPMIIAAASYWLVGAPLCVGLGVFLGWKGLGVWIGLAVGLGVAAVLMLWRFMVLTHPRRRAALGSV